MFADVAAMTPGEYVHIGGDEVLTMEPDEYATLVAAASDGGPGGRQEGGRLAGDRAHAARARHGRAVLGHPRRPRSRSSRAAQAGALLLMSPGSKAYLDMKYDASTELGLEWAGHIELRDAYDWEPSTLIPGVPGGVGDRRRGGRSGPRRCATCRR